MNVSAVSMLAFSVLAQDTQGSKKPSATTSPDDHKVMVSPNSGQLKGSAKASDILGITVKNKEDETLGKVEEVAVDVESGRIIFLVLSTGGYLGIADTLMAVPPGVLHHDVTKKALVLDSNKEKFKDAPVFEMPKWAEYTTFKQLSKVYNHYGEASAFDFVIPADGASGGSIKPGVITGKNYAANGNTQIPETGLALLQKTGKLMGTPIKNLQEEKLGKVEDILLDIPSGRVLALIVSSGGFLGMGDELSAIPPTALRFTADMETLQIDASKEVLSKAPHFKANEWPNFSHPTYADGLYRAYKVTPYFAINATTEADNTGRNVRDRDGKALTPLDQGSSKADVETTTAIRKEILGNENMSTNAKNIKIITINGRVTLRGPVNTAEEKRLIQEIANKVVRAENLDNEIEVQLTSSN